MPRTRKLKKDNPRWPYKYYAGLTPRQATKRRAEIKKFGAMHWKDPRAYVGFETDKIPVRKRKSSYTAQWDRLFPHAKSLAARSKVTGVPLKYIKKSFDRAKAAFRTGHRPGQTPALGFAGRAQRLGQPSGHAQKRRQPDLVPRRQGEHALGSR